MFNPSANEHVKTFSGNQVKGFDAGFTLIELVISLALGLLLVAAASQLFFTGVVSSRLQAAGADLQDNGVFGLDFMSKEIRLVNFGNTTNPLISDSVPFGGIVLTADTATDPTQTNPTNLWLVRTTYNPSSYVDSGLLTHGNGDTVSATTNYWQGLSNVTTSTGSAVNSDQLTIQYQAPAAMTNCAGGSVNSGDQVVERYFLRVDSTAGPATDPAISNLALVCDAGSIVTGNPSTTPLPAGSITASTNINSSGVVAAPITPSLICASFATPTTCTTAFGGAGQIIMPRVDHIHFLLGSQDTSGNTIFYTINQYMALTTSPKPKITVLKVAVLVRSMDNTGNTAIDPVNTTYTMLDQVVKAKPAASAGANRYVRKVYVSTIALHNGLGSLS